MRSGGQYSRLGLLLFYVLTFLLLWEWLRPLQYFTDTGHTYFFIFFIALVFSLTFFRVPWFIRFPLSLGFILFALHWIFYDGSVFSASWLALLLQDISQNLSYIFSGMWRDMSPLFRTLLFYVLLWLLVYLLHYWVIYQRRILFFFIMTVVYITVIDTFTPFDASYAIVRIVLFGFLLLGMLYLERMREEEGFKSSKTLFAKWFAPLVLMTAAAISIGAAAPKTDPVWPDPVPFIKTAANGDFASSGNSKVGYGTNDESLGGPFSEDDSWVFTWQGKERSYFRAETKSHYTGKGWIEEEKAGTSIQLKDDDQLDYKWYEESVRTETRKVIIDMEPSYRYNHVLYPIGTTKITLNNFFAPLHMNSNTEKIVPAVKTGTDIQNLESYSLTYESPVFDVDELKKISIDSEEDWSKSHERYLQLPASLPERVRKLARDLTKDQDNMYDKAKAVEDYLGSSDFSYDTKNVAVPKKNQDYVDQFLFETKVGYCDNFSTAMIVLLRSAGIPARWVKGYTSGDFAGTTADRKRNIYEVTNNNAHSWVEVYFKGQGWVTFEPTKGFINPEQLIEQSDSQQGGAAAGQKETEQKNAADQRQQTEKKQDNGEKPEAKRNAQADSAAESQGDNSFLWFGAAGFILLLAAAACLYYTRANWMPAIVTARLKNRRDDTVFFKAYEELLRQLKRKGMKKQEGQTLREFAKAVDDRFQNTDMTSLTLRYERALYRKENAAELWNDSAELWENLIKRR
ncbi:transglutaminase domain-containing protein [Bacillus swezeyi]